MYFLLKALSRALVGTPEMQGHEVFKLWLLKTKSKLHGHGSDLRVENVKWKEQTEFWLSFGALS